MVHKYVKLSPPYPIYAAEALSLHALWGSSCGEMKYM